MQQAGCVFVSTLVSPIYVPSYFKSISKVNRKVIKTSTFTTLISLTLENIFFVALIDWKLLKICYVWIL